MCSIPVSVIPANALSPKISIVSASFFFGRNFMLNFDFHFDTSFTRFDSLRQTPT